MQGAQICHRLLSSKLDYKDQLKFDFRSHTSPIARLFRGKDFMIDFVQTWKDSHSASGCIMFAISYYTALTLYRSAFMGKKSDMGAATLKNLGKVLSSINNNEWARKAEQAADLQILKELRDLTKVSLESVEASLVQTSPAETVGDQRKQIKEQPKESSPADALPQPIGDVPSSPAPWDEESIVEASASGLVGQEVATDVAPTETATTETAPTDVARTETVSTEAAPTEAAPTEVAHTESASTEAASTEAAPTEAAPTVSTEAAPTAAASTKAAPTEAAEVETEAAEVETEAAGVEAGVVAAADSSKRARARLSEDQKPPRKKWRQTALKAPAAAPAVPGKTGLAKYFRRTA